jgi:outer membrane protein TolC
MEISFAGRDDDLHAALAEADIVSIHCPLNEQTHHLIDAAALASMQAETAHSQIVQAAKADVAVTASQARNSVLRTQTLQASIADAERNVAISQARYAAGEADLLEVTEAEQTLASTRYALNSALADLADTVGHLRLLAGK